MAAPPPKKAMTREDVPGAPEWVDRLMAPLNAFMTPVGAALARGLTFRENFAGEVKTVEVTPPDDWVPFGATGDVRYGPGWEQFPASTFETPAWRKAVHGKVRLRGIIRKPTPAAVAGETMLSGLPGAHGQGRHAVDMAGAYGFVESTLDGRIVFGAGNQGLVSLADIEYEASDRTPPRWAKPVDVRLGTEQTPYPGRPGSVFILDVRQKSIPTTPVVVTGLDWGAVNLEKQRSAPGVRLYRVWGLTPGTTYTLRLLILPE